jgi:hypothetical protein
LEIESDPDFYYSNWHDGNSGEVAMAMGDVEENNWKRERGFRFLDTALIYKTLFIHK